MWIAGVMQGLMWRAINPDGTLVYAFVESVKAMHPFYVIRLAGRPAVPAGMLIMAGTRSRRHRRRWSRAEDPRGHRRTPGHARNKKAGTTMGQSHAGHRERETNNFGLMIVLILLTVASAAWSRSCRCSSRSRPSSRSRV